MGRASIPYTARDYDAIRKELVARIPSLTDQWTDFNPTDPGMVLLELFCGIADMLNFYLDAQTAEAFLATARQRHSVVNLSKLIGYRLDGPLAATTQLRFTIPIALDSDLIIPIRSICRARMSDGSVVDFETTAAATIPAGEVSATAPAAQGKRKSELFTARNVRGQKIRLAGQKIADGSLAVTVGGIVWQQVPDFIESRFDALHFRADADAQGVTTVTFGDGINGAIPEADAKVVVEYLETLEAAGNLGTNTIREMASSVYLNGVLQHVSVTNPVAATGGAEPETIEHARAQAPAELASLWKAVTEADFHALAEGYPGIAKAQVLDTNDCTNIRYYMVNLVVAPNGGGFCSPQLKQDLAAFLENRKVITTEVNLFDPRYREVAIDAEVVTYSTDDPALVRGRVETALRDFFAFENVGFGHSIYFSDVVALLDGVRGVSHIHLYSPAADIIIKPGEIPTLGPLNLDVKRGGTN